MGNFVTHFVTVAAHQNRNQLMMGLDFKQIILKKIPQQNMTEPASCGHVHGKKAALSFIHLRSMAAPTLQYVTANP